MTNETFGQTSYVTSRPFALLENKAQSHKNRSSFIRHWDMHKYIKIR